MKRSYIALLLVFIILNNDMTATARSLQFNKAASTILAQNQAIQGGREILSKGNQVVAQAVAFTGAIKDVTNAFNDIAKESGKALKSLAGAVKGLSILGPSFAVIGVVTAIFSIFFPEPDRFQEILDKLDQVEERLRTLINDRMSALGLQGLRQDLFIRAEEQTSTAAEYLAEMQDAKIKNDIGRYNYYRTKFVNVMKDGKGDDSLNVFYNAFKPSFSAAGKSFPEWVIETTQGDMTTLVGTVQGLVSLYVKASVSQSAYLNLERPGDLKYATDEFTRKMSEMSRIIQDLDQKNWQEADNRISSGAAATVKNICDLKKSNRQSNQACADGLLRFYANKYSGYLVFTVVAYNNVQGWDDHGMSGDNYAYVKDVNYKNAIILWERQSDCQAVGVPSSTLSQVINANRKSSDQCLRMINALPYAFQRLFVKSSAEYGYASNYGARANYVDTNGYFGWGSQITSGMC